MTSNVSRVIGPIARPTLAILKRSHRCRFCPLEVCEEAKKVEVVCKINVTRTSEQSAFNKIHTMHNYVENIIESLTAPS